MTSKALREKTVGELCILLEQQCAKLFKLRIQKGSDQLTTTHMLGDTKRLIARIKTVIAESSRAI